MNQICLKKGTFEKNKNDFKFVGLDKKIVSRGGDIHRLYLFSNPY